MAHKKGVGSSDNGRDSHSKRLGVKLFGGQAAISGNIIIRQRGTRFHPGEGVDIGRDHTIYATTDGVVTFKKRKLGRTFVSVIPKFVEVQETIAPVKKTVTVKAPAAPVVDEAAEIGTEEVVTKSKAVKEEAPKKTAKAASPKAEKTETTPKKVVKAVTPKVEKEEAPKKVTKTTVPKAGKEEAAPKKTTKATKADDLKLVEGIGAKIEELLHAGGIVSFNDLASAELSKIQEILDAAGPQYNIHDPGTWSHQAKLAADGKWDDLMELQDKLKGGK
ncbi:MAG TPA: 50S ribosomal protein L27 [Saprospiraceae bacterium]|nr:50S ribosomal protein L27 [Saprospiraceae bacterium]